MYTIAEAKKLRCPYVDKKCETDKCMAWEVVSKYDDILYENSSTIDSNREEQLLKDGYQQLPAHGLGLALKQFFPMTKDESSKAQGNTYGTQLFYGRETTDQSVWLGRCSCLNKGE